MSWLQKKIDTSAITSYYSLDITSKLLLVGLGNPGEKYDLTRHNIGFNAIDNFVACSDNFNNWKIKNNFQSYVTEGMIGEKKIIVIKPQTFMNNSGFAVNQIMNFYKINPKEIIIVYDDVDLDFGLIRTRFGGSSAGHNGIKSIIDFIGEDFNRIRIGINNKDITKPAKELVLKKFTKAQQNELPNMFKEINAIINEFIFSKAPNISAETRRFIN